MNNEEHKSNFDKKFDDAFIQNVSINPLQSIFDVFDYISVNTEKYPKDTGSISYMALMSTKKDIKECYPILVDGANLINWICKKFRPEELNCFCRITGNIDEYNGLKECIDKHHIKVKKSKRLHDNKSTYAKYNKLYENEFMYEFSEESICRIQDLINELREKISISSLFEDKHKQRLLKRLEKLQAEIHKKMSNVDIFWGLVGDAGVVIGKFGEDAKPFIDRIKEISQIVWKIQAKSEGLPDNTKHQLLEDI